jgi:pimeloyl-ACP methyl ester carboxylesterase
MHKFFNRIIISITLVTIGLTTACAQQNTKWQPPFPIDKDLYPFKSLTYQWQGYNIHYIDEQPSHGQASKGTVLALHGNMSGSFVYRKTVKPLNDQGFRVIAIDLLGSGLSDQPPLSQFDYMASTQAKVLNTMVKDLKLDNLYLMLHDWGGPIGLHIGTNMPEKIQGILLMNTWAWALPPIAEGSTHFMHPVHDRGIDAQRNPDFYVKGNLAKFGGMGIAKRSAAVGSAEYVAIRNAMWGPYLDLKEPHKPLSKEGTVPLHQFAKATVEDYDFLHQLDQNMKTLHNKPVYFAFGDDTAFGPLKVDRGMHQKRQLCPTGYQPETEEITAKTNCVDSKGRKFWAVIERFRTDWNPAKVVGIYKDVSRGHFVQDEVPDVAVQGIVSLQKFNAKKLKKPKNKKM